MSPDTEYNFTRRICCIGAAWLMGWFLYMGAVYDGVLSFMFQTPLAALFSAMVVGAAVLAGLLLRIPALGHLWRSTRIISATVATMGLLCVLFGPTTTQRDAHGHPVVLVHPILWPTALFLLLFAIANWPLAQRSKDCRQ